MNQHGNEDQGWVAHMARSAMAGEPITIYGDGKQVRDVLFVEDLVDAFALARRNIGKLSGRAFNIGGGPGNTVSLLELIRRLEELLERRVELSFDAWRVGDQRYYVSDTRKFGAATGWRANTDVEQACRSVRLVQGRGTFGAAGAGAGGCRGAAIRRARLTGE